MSSDEPTFHITPKFSGPKRQHIVPRFYLNGFCRDGLLSVYDRKEQAFRHQTPPNTSVESNYYTFTDTEGQTRYDLESYMSEYESKAAHIIRKLAKKEVITENERCDMAIFLGAMHARTPTQVDSIKFITGEIIKRYTQLNFSSEDYIKNIVMKCHKDGNPSEDKINDDIRRLRKIIDEGQFSVDTNHQWALGMSIATSASVAEILAQREWLIIHCDSPKRSFITSDSPLVLTRMTPTESKHAGLGYASTDALVIFPLDQSCVLMMHGLNNKLTHGVIQENKIKAINCLIALHSKRFIMGRDEKLVRSLVKNARLDDISWQPKFIMS